MSLRTVLIVLLIFYAYFLLGNLLRLFGFYGIWGLLEELFDADIPRQVSTIISIVYDLTMICFFYHLLKLSQTEE
jgi:hypothetical protein